MDINALLLRRQVSLMRGRAAACAPSRSAHLGLADLCGDRIQAIRALGGLPPLALTMA